MPKTAVGLFENRGLVEGVVHDVEALGFPRREVRRLTEPADFNVTGVMSFPELNYEADLIRELTRIGATHGEAGAYAEGLRHGGALVFATGSDAQVVDAVDLMNRQGALLVEEADGAEPDLGGMFHESLTFVPDSPVQTGRIRERGEGACVFVW
jgi:hypothetical protein